MERTRMRSWASIGGSTVYKVLGDLRKDEAVTVQKEKAARGPGRNAFDLTEAGKEEFEKLVKEALVSDEPIYSDRLAGMVFSIQLPTEEAIESLGASIGKLEQGLARMREERTRQEGRAMAIIMLDCYEEIVKAEIRALTRVRNRLMEKV